MWKSIDFFLPHYEITQMSPCYLASSSTPQQVIPVVWQRHFMQDFPYGLIQLTRFMDIDLKYL